MNNFSPSVQEDEDIDDVRNIVRNAIPCESRAKFRGLAH